MISVLGEIEDSPRVTPGKWRGSAKKNFAGSLRNSEKVGWMDGGESCVSRAFASSGHEQLNGIFVVHWKYG